MRAQKNPRIQLLPLGTCSGNSTPLQQHSSYLLKIFYEGYEKQILLDCGAERVGDPTYVDPAKLEIVVFSHSHADHSKSFGLLLQMLEKAERITPLIVVAHPKAWKRIKNHLSHIKKIVIPEFVEFRPINVQIGIRIPYFILKNRFSFTDYSQVYEIPSIPLKFLNKPDILVSIKGTPAKHVNDAIATRINLVIAESAENLLDIVYSPDTSSKSLHLASFAQNADWWLLDSTFTREFIDKVKLSGHSCPEYSGKLCESAHVKHFLVIHYYWVRHGDKFEEVGNNIINSTKHYYSGEITVAKDLAPILLKH